MIKLFIVEIEGGIDYKYFRHKENAKRYIEKLSHNNFYRPALKLDEIYATPQQYMACIFQD